MKKPKSNLPMPSILPNRVPLALETIAVELANIRGITLADLSARIGHLSQHDQQEIILRWTEIKADDWNRKN